jgi:HK97 family phage portal protein
MPILTTAIRQIRKTGSNPALKESHWPTWPWSTPSITGANVDETTALTLTTFYRGVNLIASTIAGLPLHLYLEGEDGEPTPIRPPELKYLWRRPNDEMAKVTFWERVVADEVRGNAFIFVDKTDIGTPASIWHIARKRVQVGRTEGGIKVYLVDDEYPMIDYKQGGEIVHIPNWGDGMVGYDIVKLAASALALGLSAEEYAARQFTNNGVPAGIITSDLMLTPEQAAAIQARWQALNAGTRNAHKIAVLGAGAKFQQTSQDLDKVQMQALRQFQSGEIATLLGIAPHMLGLVDRSTSWGSGIAEQGRGFVTYTLNGHTTRIRQAIDDDLLVRELTDRYCEFDPGGLLRGNILQQYQAHAIGFGRFLTVNEIRKDLNLPPHPGGDVLMQPLNMEPLGAAESMEMERAQREPAEANR